MSKLTQQEANRMIAKKIEQAQALITECEEIAVENGVGFRLDIGGYGMGGWFEPEQPKPDWADDDWQPSSEGGWQASSQSC